MAAANDRDVAETRRDIRDFRQAATASFNAMRSDLTDLQAEIRTGFTQVRGQLDGTAAGLEQIAGLLNALIDQHGRSQSEVREHGRWPERAGRVCAPADGRAQTPQGGCGIRGKAVAASARVLLAREDT